MLLRHISMNRISILFLVTLVVGYMSKNEIDLFNTISQVQGRLFQEFIVGGEPTALYEIPYQVSIRMFGLTLCGGAIINEEFILTAAHCIIDFEDDFVSLPISVVAGVNDLEDDELKSRLEVEVESAYVPAFYNGSSKISTDDIAVLKLRRKLDLESNFILSSVDLPPSTEGKKLTEDNSYEKTNALVTGFGWDRVWFENVTVDGVVKKMENGDSDGKLIKAKAWILPNFQCQTFYIWTIHDSQICAQIMQHSSDVHQGVCSGDSGGPLVVDNTVVGVISYSRKGCNDSKTPAMYTRVSAYIDFIHKAMKNITDGSRIKLW